LTIFHTAVSAPQSHFFIVAHKPRRRILGALLVILWLASLAAVWFWHRDGAEPALERMTEQQAQVRQERNDLDIELDRVRGELANAQRSEQVSRAANKELQLTLQEHEEEIAGLRADVTFYERLVAGSAQRQGLAVHSIAIDSLSEGSHHYVVTLTQSMKKSGLTRGEVTLAIEGSLEGRLTELNWPALRQDADAAPQNFAFRYFQQLDGVFMLPANFTPQQVHVLVEVDGRKTESVYRWAETLGSTIQPRPTQPGASQPGTTPSNTAGA
jgi:cell division protein FtsL